MKISHLCFIAAIAVAATGCNSHRSPLTYFTDIEQLESDIPLKDYNLKIEPDDELVINVNSETPEATAVYNLPFTNPAMRSEVLNTSQGRTQTYLVDSQGDINFPVLGKIHAEGMTTEQLSAYITERIEKSVKNPIVTVDFVNYFVYVAGEVLRPGRQYVTKQRYTLLDAITNAGDLTPYGERNNVLLIREQDGKRTYKRLDLNSAKTLTEPEFYLKQNDYIYIEPNNIRKDNTEYNQNNSYKLSVISTIVSGCSVIISLVIALTR